MAGNKITKMQLARLDEAQEEGVFDLIAKGTTVQNVCKHFKVGNRALYKWLDKEPGRRERYLEARVAYAQQLADEALDIADSTQPGYEQTNKLRIETRKWLAAKASPREFADKTQAPLVNISINSQHLDAVKDLAKAGLTIELEPE